ncbi:MAG: type II toxin-antitoxin system RelB/DinJ family antitoxin [Oscillospiraceae bacterium]|nr:type II toxin-antitoxin system RelB/DinJ family antitoxin [Oscillospiraceae bacterium]
MATVNYSLRIDEEDKQKAEQVFRALGMTFSTGINIYLKMVGRQQKIPFNLALDVQIESPATNTVSSDEKKRAFSKLNGVLAGHDVDLEKERTERILKI